MAAGGADVTGSARGPWPIENAKAQPIKQTRIRGVMAEPSGAVRLRDAEHTISTKCGRCSECGAGAAGPRVCARLTRNWLRAEACSREPGYLASYVI
jgi:hypothetical protein